MLAGCKGSHVLTNSYGEKIFVVKNHESLSKSSDS